VIKLETMVQGNTARARSSPVGYKGFIKRHAHPLSITICSWGLPSPFPWSVVVNIYLCFIYVLLHFVLLAYKHVVIKVSMLVSI